MGSENRLMGDLALTGDVPADVTALLTRRGFTRTLNHTRRVAGEARRLAQVWNVDPQGAEIAGWLHDVSVVVPLDERVELAGRLDVAVLPEERAHPAILHQKLSAALARQFFGILDARVLSAIECHTTLKAGASALDRIVFIADKLMWDQPGDPPYRAELLAAAGQSLEAAARCYITYLWQRRASLPVLHPWLVEAYHDLVN